MVHTVSGITLHRLRRMAAAGDAPHEARLVIGEMVRLVKETDPFFFEKVGCEELPADALPEVSFPRTRLGGDAFVARVRQAAGRPRVSGWWTPRPQLKRSVAEAVRVTFGLTRRGDGRRRGNRPGAESGAKPLSARSDERLASLAADEVAAPRQLHVREAAEPHRRFAGSAPPHGPGVAAADDVRRHGPARLRHPEAPRRQSRSACGVRPRDGRRVEREEPAARPRRAARVRACTSCPTPRRCGWSSPDRSCRSSTSGRFARASTRRRRSIWRRWTSSTRSAASTHASRATSARPASSATA